MTPTIAELNAELNERGETFITSRPAPIPASENGVRLKALHVELDSLLGLRNIFVRDTDGEWYSIPPSLEKEFLALKEEMIEMDSSSDEYMDARFKLGETFSQYLKD